MEIHYVRVRPRSIACGVVSLDKLVGIPRKTQFSTDLYDSPPKSCYCIKLCSPSSRYGFSNGVWHRDPALGRRGIRPFRENPGYIGWTTLRYDDSALNVRLVPSRLLGSS